MKIKLAHCLHTGLVRETNEDALLFCPDLAEKKWMHPSSRYTALQPGGALMAIADGMGGGINGDLASALAIKSIEHWFDNLGELPTSDDEIKTSLTCCITQADTAIKNRMSELPCTMGMGTTIVMSWIWDNKAFVAWCGDSRCYRYRPNEGLRCLSHDHSYVQELVDAGSITATEAFHHPDSNLITRGLGDFDLKDIVDIVVTDLQPNDLLILCSDGLCGYCTDDEIASVLHEKFVDIDAICEELLNLSFAAGGYDNIAIVIASVIDDNANMPVTSLVQRVVNKLLHNHLLPKNN